MENKVRSIRCTEEEYNKLRDYLSLTLRKGQVKCSKAIHWANQHKALWNFITQTELSAEELKEATIIYKILKG